MPAAHAKYVPAVASTLVGFVLSFTRHAAPVGLELGLDTTAEQMVLLTQAARVTGFVLAFVLLFGLSFWAGTRLDVPAAVTSLVGLTAVLATLGSLAGFVVVVFLLLPGGYGGLLRAVAVIVGSAIATGVKLAIVVLAGASLAHFR